MVESVKATFFHPVHISTQSLNQPFSDMCYFILSYQTISKRCICGTEIKTFAYIWNKNCAHSAHICVGATQQVHLGQDLCSGFSIENAIMEQFTLPHFSMLHLSFGAFGWNEDSVHEHNHNTPKSSAICYTVVTLSIKTTSKYTEFIPCVPSWFGLSL